MCLNVTSPVSLPLAEARFAAAGSWVSEGSVVLDTNTFPADTLASFPQYTPLSVQPGARGMDQAVTLLPAHNAIELWSWGEHDSHLAPGATSAVLTDGPPPSSKQPRAAADARATRRGRDHPGCRPPTR